MRIPRLLISVGAMKAGTSWLFELLRHHPEIEVVPIKEINYFPHVHTDWYNITHGLRLHHLKTYSAHCEIGRSVQQIQHDIEFFSRYLKDPVDDRWFCNLYVSGRNVYKAEFSNIVSVLGEDSLKHVRSLAKRIRLIYVLRDPLTRLWSHTKYHAQIDWRPEAQKRPLEELSRTEMLAIFKEFGHPLHGCYANNIIRMSKVFHPKEFKVIFYEDLQSAGQDVLDDICHFLGLEKFSPPTNSFGQIVNEGPKLAMPDAFVEAGNEVVAREFEALERIGIKPHPAWGSR